MSVPLALGWLRPDIEGAALRARNRGDADASIDILPTLWFRSTWSWGHGVERPTLESVPGPHRAVHVVHPVVGEYWLHAQDDVSLLFCDDESNTERLFGTPKAGPYVKDGIHNAVVRGIAEAVNDTRGTKVAVRVTRVVSAGGETSVVVRLNQVALTSSGLHAHVEEVFATRQREADDFYDVITPSSLDADTASVLRQALAGMLWSKQHHYFDLDLWLREHSGHPPRSPANPGTRNAQWFHKLNDDIISMPDKWEYPWYAAWDLAFHTVSLAMVDPDFAKGQLNLMLSSPCVHPTGQIPAYEWNFSDVNPPVHAWALTLVFGLERQMSSAGGESEAAADDVDFLSEAFGKLLLNFTWWVNLKDPSGKNVFEGGFLGLDNIGVFDRIQGIPSGGTLEQSDGTAWMAFFSQNMLAIALSEHDPAYEGFIVKFVHHWFQIAMAMDPLGEHPDEMWDDEDGFIYDVLRSPDGTGRRIEVRSLVELLPLSANSVLPQKTLEEFPKVTEEIQRYLDRNGDLLAGIADPRRPGVDGRRLLALVNEDKLRRILSRMLDEERFRGPHGIRSVSKWHESHPYTLDLDGQQYSVAYEPGESTTGMCGGNSNWRGPVWMPINVLLVRALLQFYLYHGDDSASSVRPARARR